LFHFPGTSLGGSPHPPFVDTSVQAGHSYYYSVRATDGTGWTKFDSTAHLTFSSEEPEARIDLRVDSSRETGMLEHKWEMALGSEHLSYLFKGDINAHLKSAGLELRQALRLEHDELGTHYIISHGILMDDLQVYREDTAGNPIYNWSGVDRVYDMLHATGLKPFVQLDFMPNALASDPKAQKIHFDRGNNSPPKDYAKWGALIYGLAKHLVDRYGKEEVESWPFEVWNQPEVRPWCPWVGTVYWGGSDEDYFRLYDYTAQALKSVDPQLQVGGPVSVFPSFVEPFLKHVTTHNYATGGSRAPLDFLDVRTYNYPAGNWRPLLHKYGFNDLPVHYTEWGLRSVVGKTEMNDMPYGAAWVAHTLYRSLDYVSSISCWTGSDYFEEKGPPRRFFYGGFGLIGLEGILKPRYWAYYLLHQLGTRRLAMEGKGDGFDGLVNGWAARNDDGTLTILLSNATDDQTQIEGNAALSRRISLNVSGLPPGKRVHLEHYRVDDMHSNVYAVWRRMGKPDWPTKDQLGELRRHDQLEALLPPQDIVVDSAGQITSQFDLPMPALSLLKIAPDAAMYPQVSLGPPNVTGRK
jgi:xylan 1,4-beta-xylosidase